jgi:hypothetical protein
MKRGSLIIASLTVLGLLFLDSCAKEDGVAPVSTTTNAINAISFVGQWDNIEKSKLNGTTTYPVIIESGSSSTILISKLYGFPSKITANVSSTNFIIPQQVIQGVYISGSGVLVNPNYISMTYIVEDGIGNDTVEAKLTK